MPQVWRNTTAGVPGVDFPPRTSDCDRLNVLIIPDKFKGTLSAQAAASAIARGWRRTRPGDSVVLLPMSDGGDGFGTVMSGLLGARRRRVSALDAAHRPCSAAWWWEGKTRTALIESAGVIGLAMLPPGKFHPFELDTFGLGQVIAAARKAGARRYLIGIGGSATNDAGFGLGCALGWRFLDRTGNCIRTWRELANLEVIQSPAKQPGFPELTVAVDVQNPLLGSRGATRVYGPQKGLRSADFPLVEACLGQLAQVVKRQVGQNFAAEPGAGAAGGLGFGLLAFAGARLEPGFEVFARQADLSARLASADLVVTGEGSLDESSLMGKGPEIARLCRRVRRPCVGLAGVLSPAVTKSRQFSAVRALTELTHLEEAKAHPAFWLERLAAEVARTQRGWI